MAEALKVVEEALREQGLGRVSMLRRLVLHPLGGKGWFAAMPVNLDPWRLLAVKAVSSYPENRKLNLPTINALTLLLDGSTGVPLALLEAGYLTGLRTGAIGGIAAKYLARRESERLGLLGSGEQAWWQLEAHLKILPSLVQVKVYSPTPSHRESFARKASEKFGIEVKAASSAREAVKDCDLVVAATTSRVPVVYAEWLKPGTHVTSVGAHHPETREVDGKLVANAKVVVDSREACLAEAGDLIIPIREGLFAPELIYGELGEIVAGLKPGRESSEEFTFFKSVGIAIQDLAVAKLAYERALKAGVGLEFNPA